MKMILINLKGEDMGRESVFVRVTAKQADALDFLMGVANSPARVNEALANSPELRGLLKEMREGLDDERDYERAMERADEIYGKGDDIEIDDDAALSYADDGTWVSAWLWVPNEDNDEEDDEEESPKPEPAK